METLSTYCSTTLTVTELSTPSYDAIMVALPMLLPLTVTALPLPESEATEVSLLDQFALLYVSPLFMVMAAASFTEPSSGTLTMLTALPSCIISTELTSSGCTVTLMSQLYSEPSTVMRSVTTPVVRAAMSELAEMVTVPDEASIFALMSSLLELALTEAALTASSEPET